MRIIGGHHRSRLLHPLPDVLTDHTRPTSDRVRESVFNIIPSLAMPFDWSHQIILDGFAGTGAMGLEAISRGAFKAFFIDKHPHAIAVIEKNRQSLKEIERTEVICADMASPPQAPVACNLIFLDPPYALDIIPATIHALDQQGWIASHAIIVCEQDHRSPILPNLKNTKVIKTKKYGRSRLTFLAYGILPKTP